MFAIEPVQVGSPLEGIADYEREYGVPHNYINVIMYALRSPI